MAGLIGGRQVTDEIEAELGGEVAGEYGVVGDMETWGCWEL